MVFELNNFLKALLMSTSEPLSLKMIQDVISKHHMQSVSEEFIEDSERSVESVPTMLTASQIRNAIDAINEELVNNQGVYRITESIEGYQLSIIPDYAYWVRLLRNAPRPLKLSQALLETLSIVAYRQPITRAEIEAIRGVSADAAISKLTEIDLVAVNGRAELPGRPMQYGTTKKFLDFSGLQSLEELPACDVLATGQLQSWIEEKTKPSTSPTDSDVGLMEEKISIQQEIAIG